MSSRTNRVNEIADYLVTHGSKSASEIAKKFGIEKTTVERYLREAKRLYPGRIESTTSRSGTIRYGCDEGIRLVEAKPKRTPKVATVPIGRVELAPIEKELLGFLSNPKAVSQIAHKFNLPKSDAANLYDQSKGIHALVSENGTTYLYAPGYVPSTHLEFKNAVFARQGSGNIWKQLPDSYVRGRKWKTVG